MGLGSIANLLQQVLDHSIVGRDRAGLRIRKA
jgi:hypothetical protein